MIGIAFQVFIFRCSVKKEKVDSLAASNVYNDDRFAHSTHGIRAKLLVANEVVSSPSPGTGRLKILLHYYMEGIVHGPPIRHLYFDRARVA